MTSARVTRESYQELGARCRFAGHQYARSSTYARFRLARQAMMHDRASSAGAAGTVERKLGNMYDRASESTAWGSEIRRRRLELGLRQDELAALSGVSTRFVHTLEQGKPTVRLDKVLAVLGQLGLDLVVEPGTGII